MKRLFSFVMATVMMLSLAIPSFAIEPVTVITPEDPNAEYGLAEHGTLSNGIEYWVINPTPTENVRMDLFSDSKTVKVRPPIVNTAGGNGVNVGEAFVVCPNEYVSVRVGGLPSTMPTVNVGCHYVNGDHADRYPSVSANALVVFKMNSPSDEVQITTSTSGSLSFTTSFTISTSPTNPAETLASDMFYVSAHVLTEEETAEFWKLHAQNAQISMASTVFLPRNVDGNQGNGTNRFTAASSTVSFVITNAPTAATYNVVLTDASGKAVSAYAKEIPVNKPITFQGLTVGETYSFKVSSNDCSVSGCTSNYEIY